MRRIVIVCLLLFLPLQWSWSMVGTIGQHDCGCLATQAWADACEHAAPDGRGSACCGGAAGVGCGSSCADCHGQPLIGLLGAPDMPPACTGNPRASDRAQHFRSHIPDHPLRPPLATIV